MTYDITTKKKKYVKHNTRPTSLQIYRFENTLGESLPVFFLQNLVYHQTCETVIIIYQIMPCTRDGTFIILLYK